MAGLTDADAGTDPFALFTAWFEQALAAKLPEPNSFVLSTATAGGAPSARVVLLKGYDERGFCFYTNYDSRKSLELKANPACAVTFHWNELERQIRIEGRAELMPAAESDEYYSVRPRNSQLGAWTSPQSRVIAGREYLDEQLTAWTAAFEGSAPPRPANWGGWRIAPTVIEFWHGRPSRLHDRVRFTRTEGGGWAIDRLAP